MLSQPINTTFDIGGGRQISLETGRLARQADGSVTVKQGNCIILATVVANKEPREGQEFLPLLPPIIAARLVLRLFSRLSAWQEIGIRGQLDSSAASGGLASILLF